MPSTSHTWVKQVLPFMLTAPNSKYKPPSVISRQSSGIPTSQEAIMMVSQLHLLLSCEKREGGKRQLATQLLSRDSFPGGSQHLG